MSTNLCDTCKRNEGACTMKILGFPNRTTCGSYLVMEKKEKPKPTQTEWIARDKDKTIIFYAKLP